MVEVAIATCHFVYRDVAGHLLVHTNLSVTCGSTLVRGHLCAVMMDAANHLQDPVT